MNTDRGRGTGADLLGSSEVSIKELALHLSIHPFIYLSPAGAQIRQVPMKQLTGGVLHSKFWVVDGRHVYVGSANMDWRSLTQVGPKAQG